jgi:hypothetical protein
MLLSHSLIALCWAMGLNLVAAHHPPQDLMVRTLNAPGKSRTDTIQAIRRALSAVRLHERDTVLKKSTSLDTSWDGAVLFS